MSVLSRPRTLRRTPVVPAPRPADHDGGTTAPRRRPAAPPLDRTSRRRRAAVALAALLLAVVAAVTAVVQLTGEDPVTLAPAELGGVTELDRLRDEMLVRRQLSSDASRATDAARDAAIASR